ncbi:hypothetical protein [Kumtagia ephedrae]|uniref:hypothetical protein n=1 Tax=Kumtagia ephedrae TaxID=2116701 RepID=UPI00105714BD|nr:hypothetical protein [Mesorhizobium ephedrae]
MVSVEDAQRVVRGLKRNLSDFDEQHFSIERGSDKYLILKDDIASYLESKPNLRSDLETQIWVPGHYEHVVQFEGSRPRRPFLREDDQLQLESRDGVTVSVKRPSSLFYLSLLDTDELNKELRRLMYGPPPGRSSSRAISELFRMYTIRVNAPAESAIGKSARKSHEIAESCIFHFAYGNGTPISFTRSWARTYYWIGRKNSESVQFPLKTYNSELVGYYNLALSSDSMVLGFLALYKILEYFFSSASEEDLHAKIKEKITAPDFSHTKPKKLRELVKAIHGFERTTNEVSSLKIVLSKYFDKQDLKDWIDLYELDNGPYFTEENVIFSGKYRLDTSSNTIIPNISGRIYEIRNAIVHNKESEVSRYIPYSGQEDMLQKEVQLLLYLAEQIIMKTGKDI